MPAPAGLTSFGRTIRHHLAALAITVVAVATPAAASADNIFVMNVGGFFPYDFSQRANDDVLLNNSDFLAFDMRDFDAITFGGEYLIGVGRFLEVGAGVGYYDKTTHSNYWDYVDADGSEIRQDLKLKVVPITFTGRIYPMGRDGGVEPYFGGGVAILNWKYTEDGEFVDFNNNGKIFADKFQDSGNTVAPVFLAGVRFPVAGSAALGGEFRWQGGKADLDPSLGFAGDRLDLGGYSALFTVHVRF